MDILGRLLTGQMQASNWAPDDDRWYLPVPGGITQAGMRVDADGAQKVGAWFRGRDLLATSVAMLPWAVYQRLPDEGGADRAKSHHLNDVIHRKPNRWQNAFQWKRQKVNHLVDHGNGYDRIVPSSRGFVGELRPIHPTLVTPEQVSSSAVVYHVRNPKVGTTTTLTQDEVFHLCGASEDGIVGKGILEYARDSLGTALATESYAAKIFSRGTLNGGTIENPGVLNTDAAKRMAESFMRTAMGDWHLPKVLEQGSKFVPNKMTPEDAQMILSRQYSVDDIARWLGVPRSMLMNSDPSFGNAEQFRQDFVDFCLGPWLSLFEFAANDQLIVATDKYFTEFTRDALVRGDIAARWQAYQVGVSTGTITRNEVRRKENMKRLEGLDEPIDPAYLSGKQTGETPRNQQALPPARDDEDEEGDEKAEAMLARARAVTVASAQRLLRKEIAAVQKAAVRHAADADAFAATVSEFYAAHVALVMATLQMSETEAQEYCARQCGQILSDDWVGALELWKTSAYAEGLAAIALEAAA